MRIVLCVLVLVACKSTPNNIVATLEEAVAVVERMPGADAAWAAARKGDTFVIGSAVRTGAASRAKLRVGKGGKLDVRPNSIVYFTRDGKKQRDDVRVETGSVEIEAGDDSVGLGEAVVEPGAKVRVESSEAGTTIVVTLGRVVLENNVIEAGKSITLGGKPAVAAVEIETARGTEQLAPGETAAVTAKDAIEPLPPPPERTVATFEAGESPTIHDARAPAALRVRFGAACTGAGTVEVAKDRAFKRIVARSGGSDGANVLVAPGTFHYRVRCPEGKGASGVVRVKKDAGTRPLPKAAARTFVELDGREYQILYQNLLPEISLTWKNAPNSLRYTFVVKPARGAEKRIPSMTSATTLEAGEIREGRYTAWAELDSGRKSEASRIVMEFDNAAPSVSIDRVTTDHGFLHVTGSAIEGTAVSVTNIPVELDRHRRFTARLPPENENEAPAVRIAHPKSGIHYYVVRDAAKR